MVEFEKANYKTQDIAIQDIVRQITYGFTLQNLAEESSLSDEKKLEMVNSIILAPDYQRDYRSTIADESSLIESILIGIPIPPIFLANDRYKGIKVLNVVDGQHRLRAFYRFKENKFKLTNLELLNDLNGISFEELDFELKEKILSHKLSHIVFTDFPGKDFELEIFNRYNKGTKPLTPQEIRHAVYNSELNAYVSSFAQSMYEGNTTLSLKEAYNATKDRVQKKKIHESIFVIMSILEDGINTKYTKSPVYAEYYMRSKALLEEQNSTIAHKNFIDIKEDFEKFNILVERLTTKVKYPFSREIYGISSRNYKFQISIAMLLAGIMNKFKKEKIDFTLLLNEEFLDQFLDHLAYLLNNSFLEDPKYNASSTNSEKLRELVDIVNFKEFLTF